MKNFTYNIFVDLRMYENIAGQTEYLWARNSGMTFSINLKAVESKHFSQ